MLRPSSNHGTQRLTNDDNDDEYLGTMCALFVLLKLKCDFFTHFGSCFLKLHDVSISHLEALVRDVFVHGNWSIS